MSFPKHILKIIDIIRRGEQAFAGYASQKRSLSLDKFIGAAR
jgi:hypothetical protein